ncbi:MAG: DUF5067 domain-containing protein [Clostridiales bacterium]|nr:DUF5067 domain-containing protein [Candidatus Blautia equi]
MKKKSKRAGAVILILLALILALGGVTGYYLYERQKPETAAKAFLHTIQTLDYDAMTSMIQSEDLSLLDDLDLRNPAYADFFRSMTEKMTYDITKTKMNLTDGEAQVTARINYLDGSEIYKNAVGELLRQIAAASISGSEVTEENLEQIFAGLLTQAREGAEETYLVTEITYPMISLDQEWKIKSLDSETLKVLSANFSVMAQEIGDSVAAAQNGQQVSMEKPVAEDALIDMETDRFRIHYTQFRITKDMAGKDCLLVYYEYTNKGPDSSCPMLDVSLLASQGGASLEAAIPETTEPALDLFIDMTEVAAGETITVCQAFSLTGMSEVTLKAGDAFAFGGDVTSQILTLE